MKGQLVLVGLFGLILLAGCGGGNDVTTAQSLAITSGGPPAGTTSIAYAGSGFLLTASGGRAPYSWSWAPASGSVLPPGLRLSGAMISGTPTQASSYKVVITVTDSQTPPAHVSNPYSITIATNTSMLSFDATSLPSGVAGSIYNSHNCNLLSGGYTPCGGFPLSATGGVLPYSFSWAAAAGSSLPPGLVLQDGGVFCPWSTNALFVLFQICGKPTTAGSFTVVLIVKDSASPQNQASTNFTIDIINPTPPSIDTSAPPRVGAVNLPYSFGFTTTGGLKPLAWSETGALPPGLSLAADGTLSGTPTNTGTFPITVTVSDSLGRNASPQSFNILVASHGFKLTASAMHANRELQTATVLADGRVLVAGGLSYGEGPRSAPNYHPIFKAETYDPVAGGFSSVGDMTDSRYCQTATLLTNGRVLIAGGYDTSFATPPGNSPVATAGTFDSATDTFSATAGNMTIARPCHTATLLNNGKVLIVGGDNRAELFDPATGTFSSTGSMAFARQGHTATLLQSGKVLVAGGPDNTAELYDPTTGKFSATGSMSIARSSHTATLLPKGTVLVTGGADNTAELYDPATGTFSTTGNMTVSRSSHTATLLNNGTVLVVGGYSAPRTVESSAEVFDPMTGSFLITGSLVTPRAAHTATLMNNGTVLVSGGTDDGAGLDLNFISPGIVANAGLYQ